MAESTLAGAVRHTRARLTAQQHKDFDDRQLLERFLRQHDEPAFAALVKRHERLVCSALRKVLSDPADIDDAFQATFLVLIRKAASIRWHKGLGPWLYAVAHRVAVHAKGDAQRRSRHEGRAARAEAAAALPEDAVREACGLVHEELDRLPDKLRLPLLACYLEGKSRDEVAEQLGVTVGTVKGRLERGRDALRDRLVRRGVPLSAGLVLALSHSPARASSPALVQAAVAAMAAPGARVAALAQGVSATMILSKFKLALTALVMASVFVALLGSGNLRRAVGVSPLLSQGTGDARPALAREGEVAGRVLDGKGQPLAGATVSIWTKTKKLRQVAESAADGRFRFAPGEGESAGTVIARAKGLAPDWASLRDKPDGDLTLRLEEDVPVEGRMLDLEGRPIAGVTVKVIEVMRSKTADLTPYLDAYGKITSGVAIPRLVVLPPEALGLPATVTTEKDGRFRVAGVGRERAVTLYTEGRGTETQWFTAITRPGMKVSRSFRGPSFDLLVGPGKELAGVVKEKGSGKPIAGAEVTCQRGRAHTDEQGRYRIPGLTKQTRYHAFVSGPRHFRSMAEVKDTPGVDALAMDFELSAGLYVDGVLREKGTGKPVSGQVNYFIESDNPHLKTYTFPQGVGQGGGSAGDDGKFRVLVIPGRGYLTATADKNLYTRATPAGWDGGLIQATPNAIFPYYHHALAKIDVDEKKPESLKCDLEVDRGVTKPGRVVGPDGQPVTDVIAFGLTAVPDPGSRTFPRQPRHGELPPDRLKDGTFTVVGLDAKQPRHLVFVHPEKKLGKVVLVTDEEAGDLVVKLEPLGSATGRALGKDGSAAEGSQVQIYGPRRFAFYKDYPIEMLHNNQNERQRMGRLTKWLPDAVKTDAAGRFRVEGLLPGLRYTLWVREGDDPQGAPSHADEKVSVEAGKTTELGDLKRTGGF